MHDRFVLLKRERNLNAEELSKLDTWTNNYPSLGEAYRLKEEFFDLYDARTGMAARHRFRTWEASIPLDIYPHFEPIVTAWNNWELEIMSYFGHPITNSHTESLNNLIRVMNRLGRGYSFEALRATILFTEGIHKRERVRPKFERRAAGGDGAFGNVTIHRPELRSTQTGETEINYGADISTLIQLLEEGKL